MIAGMNVHNDYAEQAAPSTVLDTAVTIWLLAITVGIVAAIYFLPRSVM